MPIGSRNWRAPKGFALITVALMAGCQGLAPVPTATGAAPPADSGASAPTTGPLASSLNPAPLPPLPADPKPEPGPDPAPTPYLDKALAHAEAMKAIIAGERIEGVEPLAAEAAPPLAQANTRGAEVPTPNPVTEAGPALLRVSVEELPTPNQAGQGPSGELLPRSDEPAGQRPRPEAPVVGAVPRQEPTAPETPPRPADRPEPTRLGESADDRDAPEPLPPIDRPTEIASAGTVVATPAEAALEIADLRLCRRIRGYGNVEPFDATSCGPGQTVLLYCEVTGLRYDREREAFRSRLASWVEVRPDGSPDDPSPTPPNVGEAGTWVEVRFDGSRPPVWRQPLGQADDRCGRPRRDYYVGYRFTLPPRLAPGSYRLVLIQKDLLADRTTSSAVAFTVRNGP